MRLLSHQSKAMQYAFRNTVRQDPTTITLLDTKLVVVLGNSSRSIPYTSITRVQMEQIGNRLYAIRLFLDRGDPILVTNRQYASSGALEIQSHAYSTFVRVLHFHLREKTKADFVIKAGKSFLWLEGVGAAALAFGLVYMGDNWGISSEQSLAAVGLIGIAFGTFLFLHHRKKVYSPNDIPLELLP